LPLTPAFSPLLLVQPLRHVPDVVQRIDIVAPRPRKALGRIQPPRRRHLPQRIQQRHLVSLLPGNPQRLAHQRARHAPAARRRERIQPLELAEPRGVPSVRLPLRVLRLGRQLGVPGRVHPVSRIRLAGPQRNDAQGLARGGVACEQERARRRGVRARQPGQLGGVVLEGEVEGQPVGVGGEEGADGVEVLGHGVRRLDGEGRRRRGGRGHGIS
jgi:hypothetical protein